MSRTNRTHPVHGRGRNGAGGWPGAAVVAVRRRGAARRPAGRVAAPRRLLGLRRRPGHAAQRGCE